MHIEHICTFVVTFFSATIDGRDLIFGHKLHIGIPYRGKRFWIHHIPTSCLRTLLIFMHIEHTFCICPFLVAFFSATIDGRNLIFGHKLHIGTPYRGKRFLTRQITTSCLPKSGDIISEHWLTVHLVFSLYLFVTFLIRSFIWTTWIYLLSCTFSDCIEYICINRIYIFSSPFSRKT
jgi:hypothetical protein